MPWAVYLADGRGRYQLLGSDLDAARGPVVEDVAELCALLAAAEIVPLACAPGPGGWRLWARLATPRRPDWWRSWLPGWGRLPPSLGYGEVTLRTPGRPARLSDSTR